MNKHLLSFWQNLKTHKDHIYSYNSVLSLYGEDLFQKGYDYLSSKDHIIPFQHCPPLYYHITNIEQNHLDKLQSISKRIVSEIFEFNINEINMETHLNENSNIEINDTKPPHIPYDQIRPYLKDEINKRILLNLLIQGGSTHTYISLHHLVKEELNEIDPSLTDLYSKLTCSSLISYYEIDYSANAQLLKMMAIGSSHVEYDNDTPKIIANSKTFPILCQELSKGVLELLSFHGLECLDEDELETIYSYTDNITDEPRLIQIGAEFWRRFLWWRDTSLTIPEQIMLLAQTPAQEICEVFEDIIDINTERA